MGTEMHAPNAVRIHRLEGREYWVSDSLYYSCDFLFWPSSAPPVLSVSLSHFLFSSSLPSFPPTVFRSFYSLSLFYFFLRIRPHSTNLPNLTCSPTSRYTVRSGCAGYYY